MRITTYWVIYFCIIIWLLFFTLTYLSVPFFKLLCQDTGPNGLYGLFLDLKNNSYILNYLYIWGNNLLKFWFLDPNLIEYTQKYVDIQITYKINDALNLEFFSNIKNHRVLIGKPELLISTVKNNTNEDIVFTSIYNVYPAEALPYLEKIQCFCYDDQILEGHDIINLPVYYRINPNILLDPTLVNLKQIVISYSIFRS
jgi:cytochrome c oxidase assembly protein Cox11